MKRNGFTLIEMVVALFIFALLAAAGVSLLTFSTRAQAAASERLDVVASERRMSALLSADLAQAMPRTTRDAGGGTVPAFAGTNGVGVAPILSYVRGGWTNPDGAPRAGIQRVDVALNEGRLERRAFAMADGAVAGMPTILAGNVESIALRYRDKAGWHEAWDGTGVDPLPRAVEMTLKRAHEAPLTIAFLVGVQYP